MWFHGCRFVLDTLDVGLMDASLVDVALDITSSIVARWTSPSFASRQMHWLLGNPPFSAGFPVTSFVLH